MNRKKDAPCASTEAIMTMENEQIACSDCGVSFLFSGAEAAFYAEKQLAPPKRCKACRAARKQRNGGGERSFSDANGGFGGSGRPPRGTGNRDEYRSPMPVETPPAWGESVYRARAPRPPFRGGGPRPDGEYRAPSFPSEGRPRVARANRDGRPPQQREGFPIVCKSCGVSSTVPFRPVEGRDVFCRDCYRARGAG